jgi:hypothetical protein
MARRAGGSGAGPNTGQSVGRGGRNGGARPFEPHRQERSDRADAFLPDPDGGPAHSEDDLAESLGEGFVEAATTAQSTNNGKLDDEVVPEEIGGPFVESDDAQEFASGVDESNPADAEREPLPRAVAGLVESSAEEAEAARADDGDEVRDEDRDDARDGGGRS